MTGDTLTSSHIRSAMTPPPGATLMDLMAVGASGYWEIPLTPKAPHGTRRRRRLTWTRRIQAFRRWRRAERLETVAWTIESIDAESQTVTVKMPCITTAGAWWTTPAPPRR